jgi:hypothetical protein
VDLDVLSPGAAIRQPHTHPGRKQAQLRGFLFAGGERVAGGEGASVEWPNRELGRAQEVGEMFGAQQELGWPGGGYAHGLHSDVTKYLLQRALQLPHPGLFGVPVRVWGVGV